MPRSRFFDDFDSGGEGLQHDHVVSIWTDEIGGALQAQTTITNASTPVASTASNGRWLFNSIMPVRLEPGQYVIGAHDPACEVDCDRIRLQATTVTTTPGITFVENRDGSPAEFPPGGEFDLQDLAYFGPSFRGVVVPEPSSGILLAWAMFCACAGRRRTEQASA